MNKIKKCFKIFAAVIFIFFVSNAFLIDKTALAAPLISGISGTVANGNAISISGNSFGSTGPNVLIFDDFENGTVGSTISLSAQLGQWSGIYSETNGAFPSYSSDFAKGGLKSMKTDFAGEGGGIPCLELRYADTDNLLLSWWQYLPTNRNVPGTNNPDGPNWKYFWIGRDDGWPWGSDFVAVLLEDAPGWTVFAAADDTNEPERWYGGTVNNDIFNKGVWTRFTVYLKNSTSNGAAYLQEINDVDGMTTPFNVNSGIVTAHANELWNILTLPGYGRSDSNSVIYFDDVYFATGSGARARVEIGDNANYASCKKMALITPTAWAAGSITATVRTGAFQSGQSAYLFVTDASGNVNLTGYPITVGSSGEEDTTAPSSPSGLSVS